MSRAPEQRQSAYRFGLNAERLAELLLRLKGYRIKARRFKTPVGEIDLIARRGGLIAFVEVKARAGHTDALEAVSARQRIRIERAAEFYLSQHPQAAEAVLRFDMIVVTPNSLPRHLPDAWRPD